MSEADEVLAAWVESFAAKVTLPVLPYSDPVTGRSSGHSGMDTSAARAHDNDASGRTRKTQQIVMGHLSDMGVHGATSQELRQGMGGDYTGWHHGMASGALSHLHKGEVIAMLTEARNRHHVYVLPQFVNGRPTKKHGERG